MDIPSNPKSIKIQADSTRLDAPHDSSKPAKSISLKSIGPFTTSKELALPVGQQILAKVLAEVNRGKLVTGVNLEISADGRIKQIPLSAEQQAALNLNNKLGQQKSSNSESPATKQWLLEVGGKYLLTKTDFSLRPGQDIALQGLENFGLKLLPKGPIAAPELLRQAMVRVLPQQVSLQSGLELLSQLAGLKPMSKLLSGLLASGTAGEQQAVKHWAGIITQLVRHNSLSQESLRNTVSPSQIKQWIDQSGLLSEAGAGLKDMRLIPELSANQARVLQLAGQLPSEATPKNTIELLARAFELAGARPNASAFGQLSANAPSAQHQLADLAVLAKSIEAQQSKLGTLLTALGNRNTSVLTEQVRSELSGILNSVRELQSSFNTTRNAVLSSHSGLNDVAQKLLALNDNPSGIAGGDLKSNLVKLVIAMQSALATTQKDPELAPRGLSETALLSHAFEFPRFDLAINKATSILADQELNTGQLLKLAAALLNRIQFNQLNSLSQTQASPDTLTQTWNFELPFVTQQHHLAALSFRLEREQNQNSGQSEDEEKQTQWKIVLAFELEELGPIYVETRLTPPIVRSKVWAERESTAELVRQEQTVLQNKLSALGLEVAEFQCLKGKPARQANPINRNLVDIRA